MKKWQNIVIKPGSREFLGALAEDFLASKFEEAQVSSDEIFFLTGKKTTEQITKETMADNDMTSREKEVFLATLEVEGIYTKDDYNAALERIAYFLQSAQQNMPKNEEGLGFAATRNLNQMKELYTALIAWGDYYNSLAREIIARAGGENASSFNELDKHSKELPRKGLENLGATGMDMFYLFIVAEAKKITADAKKLEEVIPVAAKGAETLQEAKEFFAGFSDLVKGDKDSSKKISIIQKMLDAMIEGYSDLEIEKHFAKGITKGGKSGK